jgi:hypothetical protein
MIISLRLDGFSFVSPLCFRYTIDRIIKVILRREISSAPPCDHPTLGTFILSVTDKISVCAKKRYIARRPQSPKTGKGRGKEALFA